MAWTAPLTDYSLRATVGDMCLGPQDLPRRLVLSLPLIRDRPQKVALCPSQVGHLKGSCVAELATALDHCKRDIAMLAAHRLDSVALQVTPHRAIARQRVLVGA